MNEMYRANFKEIEWRELPVERTAYVPSKRSHLPGPMVIGDTMEPTQHMCDGIYYTSKAKFRSVTRAHKCVEAGDDRSITDPKPFKRPRPDRKQIRQSADKALARVGITS